MAQWVAFQPIFEVCAAENIYEGGKAQEGGLLAPRGGIEANWCNLGRNLAGSKEEEATGRDSHPVGASGISRSRAGSRYAGADRQETPGWADDLI